MWLTTVLLRRYTPGRIHGGKHRLVKKVTATMRSNKLKNERRIESNERLLAAPFLTHAQEQGHSWDRRQEERKMFNDSWQAYKARKMTDVYAFGPKQGKSKSENILEHLNVSRTEHD